MSTLDAPAPAGSAPTTQARLRASLERLVAERGPGDLLPAERVLAGELGVARMTLRRALDALVADGLLVRRAGSGTFVAGTKVNQRLAATSFSADMRARGLRPDSRTVHARTAPAGAMLAAVLDVPPETPVLHVRRLRLADDVPMALEDLHVPATVAPGLRAEDLDGASYYDLLAARHGTPVVSGTQTVEPALAADDEAALLDVTAGDPVFRFERTTRVADGRVAEFVRSTYRGDRYRIVVDIFPPAPADGSSV
ncbi:GntR family transcriptional regulator [Nocardioides nanhaiensis]|uniref:GntR family transcriptional regulator n=1 Tax=Nocardioides nanhaiensis TaxID=1476871 RepID=A0ABP8WZ17_9ACTN